MDLIFYVYANKICATRCYDYRLYLIEAYITYIISLACQANQFTCTARNTDNTPQCIASSARCDSNNDCKDKSDEAGCGMLIH